MNGLFKDTIEGMWTYALDEYKNLNINYFLYWKMIENACQRGFKKFHLGRSTANSTAVSYKKKWNAIPVQLYWEYIMDDSKPIPELNVDNPKYKLLINAWRRLPLKLTQTVGPYFAKNIP
jgi:lipid II:glycine glycyltransferase (peptidoglycan interpeptide bridge formation enzyme)